MRALVALPGPARQSNTIRRASLPAGDRCGRRHAIGWQGCDRNGHRNLLLANKKCSNSPTGTTVVILVVGSHADRLLLRAEEITFLG